MLIDAFVRKQAILSAGFQRWRIYSVRIDRNVKNVTNKERYHHTVTGVSVSRVTENSSIVVIERVRFKLLSSSLIDLGEEFSRFRGKFRAETRRTIDRRVSRRVSRGKLRQK